jgi:hypothetical protein
LYGSLAAIIPYHSPTVLHGIVLYGTQFPSRSSHAGALPNRPRQHPRPGTVPLPCLPPTPVPVQASRGSGSQKGTGKPLEQAQSQTRRSACLRQSSDVSGTLRQSRFGPVPASSASTPLSVLADLPRAIKGYEGQYVQSTATTDGPMALRIKNLMVIEEIPIQYSTPVKNGAELN